MSSSFPLIPRSRRERGQYWAFALRPYHPSARRVYRPAAVPERRKGDLLFERSRVTSAPLIGVRQDVRQRRCPRRLPTPRAAAVHHVEYAVDLVANRPAETTDRQLLSGHHMSSRSVAFSCLATPRGGTPRTAEACP